MTSTTTRRFSCVRHIHYGPGCVDCRQIRRTIYASRPRCQPNIESDVRADWAIWVTGEFLGRISTHVLPALDETVGRRRTAWWRSYRHDVTVVLRTRRQGTTIWTEVSA